MKSSWYTTEYCQAANELCIYDIHKTNFTAAQLSPVLQNLGAESARGIQTDYYSTEHKYYKRIQITVLSQYNKSIQHSWWNERLD